MLIYEYKLDGKRAQYAAIDEAIRVVQFIRNKCLRLWMDGTVWGTISARRRVSKNDLQCSCAVLAKEYSFLVSSHDLIAYEHLQIRNLVKNHKLAKSLHDAAWGQFLNWVKAYAVMHGIEVVAVPPQYTSQDCSGCGERVQKTLSTRTHVCPTCGLVLDRDENAARNILAKALRAVPWGTRKPMSSSHETLGER